MERIKNICAPLELTLEQLLKVKSQMIVDLNRSLQTETTSNSGPLNSYPTFVQDFPHGCEHGQFLVINLEDSNIRIYLYHLKGQNKPIVKSEFYEIPQELFEDDRGSEEVFDLISQSLHRFIKKYDLVREPLPLAVVFQFPLKHESLTKATLAADTNRFNFSDLLEVDVGNLLKESINRRNPRVELLALLNGATSVLLSTSCQDSCCKIGVVLGEDTCNASYVKNIQEISTAKDELESSKPTMIVHLDWGGYDIKYPTNDLLTTFDGEVDKLTSNPGLRLMDKMICGNYVAEIARQIFLICTQEGIIFSGELGRLLRNPFTFTTRHIVEVLAESDGSFDNTRLMFDRLGVMKPNDNECSKVRYIVEVVARRSAALLAASMACLIEKIDDPHTVIGISGGFYRENFGYQEYLRQFLVQLIGEDRTFDLKFIQDGCSRGGAILAAMAVQHQFVYNDK